MNKIKNISVLILLSISHLAYGQTLSKTFKGWWAMTGWTFDFNADGTFIRKSVGHYGSTLVSGNYKVKNDTILILNGFKNTHGTVSEKYLIDGDSIIIDLKLYYDYKLKKDDYFYNSKKRYDILTKPNPDSSIILTIVAFDSIVKDCISQLSIRKYSEINNQEHLKIIRIINTIRTSKTIIASKEIYNNFIKLIKEKYYENDLTIYFDNNPTKKMGIYLKELQIELGGVTNSFSRYTIK